MIPNKPKFKIGDTVILKMRWFLWFENYVLCEIVSAVYYEREMPEGISAWRYTLKIGNQFRRFLRWEDDLLHENKRRECKERGGKYMYNINGEGYCDGLGY